MKSKKWPIIILGTIVMLTGIGLKAFGIASAKITQAGVITMGMVMIITGVVNMIRKQEGVVKDELSRKIADRAAAYSWVITLLALLVVFWLNHFEIIQFSVNAVISITYVVMIATMLFYQKKFWKGGIKNEK